MLVLGLAWQPAQVTHALAAPPRQQPHSCGLGPTRASGGTAGRATGKTTASGGAQITLNITHGAPGSRIVAQGSGWPAGAQVMLVEEQGGQVIPSSSALTLTVAGDGGFVAPAFGALGPTCGFDPQPGMAIQIEGHSTTDTSLTASATFTYVAAPPTLAPATPGGLVPASASTLPVGGTNWDAGTLVTLWPAPQWPASAGTPSATGNPPDLWQPPAGVSSVQMRADAQGAFSAQVPVPAGSLPLRPGSALEVAASASSPRYGTLATSLAQPLFIQPTAAPTLTLDRAAGQAGAELVAVGDHWWPGDAVRIAYCRDALRQCNPNAVQELGTATVDGAGHFSAQVALPLNARPGPITIEAYAGSGFVGPYLVARPFQVVAATQGPVRWSDNHPWLARALPWLGIGLVVLLAVGVAAALWLLPRHRRAALR